MSTTHAASFAQPLASLLVPGLGLLIKGRFRAGALILAGFAASALIPVPVVSISAMFGFWLVGLTTLYDAQD